MGLFMKLLLPQCHDYDNLDLTTMANSYGVAKLPPNETPWNQCGVYDRHSKSGQSAAVWQSTSGRSVPAVLTPYRFATVGAQFDFVERQDVNGSFRSS